MVENELNLSLGDTFLVIPTAGRTQYLENIFRSSGLPPSQRILVWTKLIEREFPDCINLQYEGDFNISKWWNFGIDFALSRGAEYVAVLNDDTWIDSRTLPDMRLRLQEENSVLAISSSQNLAGKSSGGGGGTVGCCLFDMIFGPITGLYGGSEILI